MTTTKLHGACLLAALLLGVVATPTIAQNPVQWSGSVSRSVDRASEQMLPLLFWVTGHEDIGEDNDLEDAQEHCFRDPVVVGIIQRHYVPVRVSLNSRVIEEAHKRGLPTDYGLYCAVLTPDGRLLASMGPGEVANPGAFAAQLNKAYAAYCDDLYQKELRPVLENAEASKATVRRAAQTVWRLDIRQADAAIIGLLERPDLSESERSRLYSLIAALGTKACVQTLLDRADDRAAAQALARAEPPVLEGLLPELPRSEGPVSDRQLAAYDAAVRVCRMGSPRPASWWAQADAATRGRELDKVRSRADAVLTYWTSSQGVQR